MVPVKRTTGCGASRSGRRSKAPYASSADESGASGKTRPSGSTTWAAAPLAARADTLSCSPLCAQIAPRGSSESASSQRPCAGGTNRGGNRTRRSETATSPSLRASRWKIATESSGSGSQARKAPSGATGICVPSMVSVARPLPVEPNRKVLSRAPRGGPSGGG